MKRFTAHLLAKGEYTRIGSCKAKNLQQATERMIDPIEEWLDAQGLERPQAIAYMRGEWVVGFSIAVGDSTDLQRMEEVERELDQAGLIEALRG